ncbi:Ferredoxin [Phycisphaerae bacterium RAS1]|nr:Ferredoxin [Phycisphaerae bacterium RAS1]
MEKKLRVRIDYNRCVGSTLCIHLAPRVFGLNEKRQSAVVNASGDTPERICAAAEQCPVSAITVEDAITGRQLFP